MPVGVVAVVVVALISGCAAKDGAMTPKQRYDALFAEMRAAQETSYAETVVAVERAYARLFPEAVRSSIVSKADRAGLDALLDAADGWSTPTFYFLDGARVVKKVVGWPKEGRMQELRDGAKAIGLAP